MKSTLAFVILILSGFSAFATVYHSNGLAADVQLIHDTQAVDGDTITLPAGIFSWATHVTITKGITIQGQTTTDSDNGTANDQTILVDNLVHISGDQGFFHCTTNTGHSLRITGITFTGVGGRGDTMYNGAIRFGGTSNQVRIDHCHFTGGLKHNNYIAVYSTIYGVADHLVIDNLPSQLGQQRVFNGTGYGDLEFSQPAGWGGSQFFFFEDCYINNTAGPFTASGGVDCANGGKYVVRHCHLYDVEILCHGTEADRKRGGRAYELYNNDYHWSYQTTMDGIRSGSMIAHDNTFSGTTPLGYGLQTYRLFTLYPGTPWLAASGDNPWDVNVTEPDGSHVDGHPPYLFESGTVTSGSENCSAGLQYFTDTSKNWTTNQWAGYTARRLSDNWIGEIISNTSNTLTMFFYFSGGGCVSTWRSGNQYQIHKALVALDQPGRGQGDLITGNPPINSTTGNAAWPHQELEPCYSWNNIHSPAGEHINFRPASTSAATLLPGRDYFNDTPMPGYTPYTYPHPLASGGPTPTPAPTATATIPPSPTPTATFTPMPTATATATATPKATATPTPRVTPTPVPTPTPTATILINCGGPTYLDSEGQLWSADMDFVGGSTFSTTHSITGTLDPTLYQTERYAPTLTYNIPVINNTYTVTLYFAEIYFNGPGERVFDVSIEGQTVLQNFDIWAVVGQFAALQQTFVVTVTDGVLNIVGTASVNNAKFSAIQVVPGSSAPTPTPTVTPTPTPTPTATPSPTATATPCLATVPDFFGVKIMDAQTTWQSAGFSTEVITDGPPGQTIMWQSLPPGYQGDCSTTVIVVSDSLPL